jgi:hypothetical protein
MTAAVHHATVMHTKVQFHINGSANRSVTNNPDILMQYKNIRPYSINGVIKDEVALALQQLTPGCPGEHFHMDMGFVRGKKLSYIDEDGCLVASLDGYSSYLLIIDRASRYTWVFLTKGKTPQMENIRAFLDIHGSKHSTQRYIWTYEGGKLGRSHKFQMLVCKANYIFQSTAPDASFQNGIAECPNLTFGDMMRCML